MIRLHGKRYHCLLDEKPTDMNVYDAAALSAVCEGSERSVATGAVPWISGLHAGPLADEPAPVER